MIPAAEQGQAADQRMASGPRGAAYRLMSAIGSFVASPASRAAPAHDWLDRALPIGVKLGLSLAAVIALVVLAYLFLALPVIRSELARDHADAARSVATIVQAEYALHGSDRAELDRFVRGAVLADPSIARIRIYRIASGVPVLWASSDAADPSTFTPTLGDLAPITTGETTQAVEEVGGMRLLETIHPLRSGSVTDATVGIYTSLAPLDAAVDAIARIVLLTAVFAAGLVLFLFGPALYLLVLRPIQRLHRAALRVAAGDLSVRSPDGEELPTRDEIVGVTRAFDHMTRMVAEQRAELERIAMRDGLTGLLNRRSFDHQIELEMRRADRLGYPLAVLMLDLDGFKRINDTHGHQAGDDALVRAAAALRAAVRDVDIVARYGGDEFTVIQPGSDLEAALVAGTRIRAAIEGLGIVIDPPSGTLLRASVGVAAWRPGQDPGALVAAADAALYRAKARGGGVEVAERASSAA